jgi:hypothetical protein
MRIMFHHLDLPAALLGAAFLCGTAYAQLNIAWQKQLNGSHTYTAGVSGAVDGVYVAGYTGDSLPGQTNSGLFDAFLIKYDINGNELWTRQFGTGANDYVGGVSATADGVYVSGTTFGAFPGQTSSGQGEAFLRKYDPSGNELWTRQFGSTFGTQSGTISVAADGVYLVGETAGALPGQTQSGNFDGFVRKYDVTGRELWTRQFGSACGAPVNTTNATSVAAAVEAVYVGGYSTCPLAGQTNFGDFDAFLRKYDANGNELWTREFGSPAEDEVFSVSAGANSVYVGGRTAGALPGQTHSDPFTFDAFVRAYDFNGSELWTGQFNSSNEHAAGLAPFANGVFVAYVAGLSEYDLNGNGIALSQFPNLKPGAVHAATGKVYVAGGLYGNDAAIARLVPDLSVSDTTPPAIVPQIAGALGNNGWYRSAVTVTWSVTDPESGIQNSSGCAQTHLTSDTAGTNLTCSAINGTGLSSSVTVTVRIDQTAPVIGGMPAPGCSLWPPNGDMVPVATVTAEDALSGLAPKALQVTATSNEPPSAPEISIAPDGTGGYVISLQADRFGKGSGRIYTLMATATDLAGNTGSATGICTVPHDQGH